MRKLVGPLVIVVFLAALWALFKGGNPGGISDAKYSEYRQLAPPKLLYSCTRSPSRETLVQRTRECMKSGRAGCDEEVNEWGAATTETTIEFAGGSPSSTYEQLLEESKQNCSTTVGSMGRGEIKVLESNKG